ncbi:hypothetical protein [Papillibacter cinnamivorans]|uniref:Uncharacterized protein n=1 Tax=Papillibacter cinnamivorans DSM 12816 TaxID=1122930 RepID=A0A1W2C5P0_9FIRM|nr:hypothetical protein [Papillibacter cinnamivorans]SMC80577.1 hypothetical protein SAMN02745168_2582 [Papillibacter cinnamivorans DSM 12816]
MPGKRWITEENRRKIAADYLRSGNYRAAARENHVAPNTVKNIIKELGAEFAGKKEDALNSLRAELFPAEENETAPSGDACCSSCIGREPKGTGTEGEEGCAKEAAEEDEIRSLLRLLLRRMGDPEAVMELNAYQAARVYAMLSDKVAGKTSQKAEKEKEEEACIRVSFGSVPGEDLSLLAR